MLNNHQDIRSRVITSTNAISVCVLLKVLSPNCKTNYVVNVSYRFRRTYAQIEPV